MKQVNLNNFNKCSFGNNVSIKAETITIFEGVHIEDNVIIEAEEVIIGHDAVIEKDTVIKGLGKPMAMFKIGDNTFIGFSNRILVPYFEMLDYSQLHNSGLHSGYEPLTVGYNCWIGQNTILNAAERLQIGNNVRIGTQSQLWTHVASGELLEGCTLFGKKPLILKDNVWIVGGAVISPGLVLEENSIIMTGAVLTKSTQPFSTFAGVPASDVTSKLNFWKEISLDEKFILLKTFVDEFIEEYPFYRDMIAFKDMLNARETIRIQDGSLLFSKQVHSLNDFKNHNVSIFDLTTKRYTKKRSEIEIAWMKFAIGYRARFIPIN